MDIKINNSEILHIIPGHGWFIDNGYSGTSNTGLSTIVREVSDSDILNHPCIYVMSACNGTCQYCYQNDHLVRTTPNLSFDDIERFIVDMNELQDSRKSKSIELFGGEPLLRNDIMKIIELLKNFGYKIQIATNGTVPILKDSKFLELIRDDVHIRISLDGHTPDLHEKYRTSGSFNIINENIKYLRNAGIDVSVKSIITDNNFSYIEDILRYLRDELDVKQWNYNVLYKLDAYQKNRVVSHIEHFDMVKELCKQKYDQYLPMLRQTPFTQMLTTVFVKHTKRYRRSYIFLNYDKKI